MGVSENNGTPKSSILIGFSIINHPFGVPLIFGNTHMIICRQLETRWETISRFSDMLEYDFTYSYYITGYYRFVCQSVSALGQLNLQASTRVLGTSKTDE